MTREREQEQKLYQIAGIVLSVAFVSAIATSLWSRAVYAQGLSGLTNVGYSVPASLCVRSHGGGGALGWNLPSQSSHSITAVANDECLA
ncbi:hypothetical protein BD311DRAFT_660886 [Dichomitus squalens]|uniref:Uncharacterized protein n=1 Tax=Dichomitus squalens TaxID=114155 RepID=A0A4Q9MP62_9APHY|nr:hypothetical protein BD311DRAFT_660886 [Dichomitus squalens]